MIVSTFELLIKRIATVPPAIPANISSVFRRVVEGYFLSISNLQSDRSIKLALRINISLDSGNRVISNANTQCFFDVNSTNNAVLGLTDITPAAPANIKIFRSDFFTIPPRQTGLVTLLPNVIPFLNVPNPELEIRGFIEVVQARGNIIKGTPASEVLLTPEIRGTFLDNDFPSIVPTNELDFDQISYALPLSTGKAMNIIEKVSGLVLPRPFDINTFDVVKFRQQNLEEIAEVEEFIEMINDMKGV